MHSDLTRAKQLLVEGEYTVVLCAGSEVITSASRGVEPLLEWVGRGASFAGYTAADRIVGNAAAYLYAILGVKEVFAFVMSEKAVETLLRYGISALYDEKVPAIKNRAGDGFCPMETAVEGASDKDEALAAIIAKRDELRAGRG